MLDLMIPDVDRKAGWLFPRGCAVGALILLLAFGLMIVTKNVTRHNDTFACYGGPERASQSLFWCDYSGGGSPVSSANKIDLADFPYFSPQGTLVDMLFYSIQLGMIWLVVNNLLQANYRLAILVVLLYLAGFLSAILLLGLTDVRIERSFPRTPMPLPHPQQLERIRPRT